MDSDLFVPHSDRHIPEAPPEEEAEAFYEVLRKRRSIREFDSRPVSIETIEWCVRCACTAPSGANKQPWRFVVVGDPQKKREIRLAAEEEERQLYRTRANEQWLNDLAPLGTDAEKPFLEVAPWLVVAFKLLRGDDGSQVYYANESVGLATGLFLAACHRAGLSTLTHTPSPMGFLRQVLGRPEHERPFVLIPVGYATDDCQVPRAALERKPLDEVLVRS